MSKACGECAKQLYPPGLWPVLRKVTLALRNHARVAVVEGYSRGLRALVKRSNATYSHPRYLETGPSSRDADSLGLGELLSQITELLASADISVTVHLCI